MTNADYQKRLSAIITQIRSGRDPDTRHFHITELEAKQALTALCRDVCGEVIGSAAIGDYAQAQQSNAVTAILGQPQEEGK